MKSTILVLGVLFAFSGVMTGCMKSVDNQDEAKALENDNDILKYLADSIKAVKDPSGYYILKRVANPIGETIKLGNSATIGISGYLLNGVKVISDTVTFPVGGATLISGIELAATKLATGDKAVVFLPFYLAFEGVARPNIPAYSPIRLEMEVFKTRTEVQQIEEYIQSKTFPISERTTDNLFIIRTDSTKGTPIGAGKAVSVKFIGKFLDDTKFDEGNFSFTTGTNGSVAGFDKAVQLLPPKAKAIIVFPSALGYKATGYNVIPGYTPLMFQIEIL